MASDREILVMRRAIELARRGLGTASPNPVVGCVVLDGDQRTVGEGWHERPGEPHAEVNALRAAGARARGGTAVVTLEPCNHYGRTPPCRLALIEAGIARVVYAVTDPNPTAEGGAQALRNAGVDVEGGVLEDEAARVNEAWLTTMREHRPFVTWTRRAETDDEDPTAAASGLIATEPMPREQLCAQVDAIIVGADTEQASRSAPALRDTVNGPRPLRIVFDHNDPRALLTTLVERGILYVLLEDDPAVAQPFPRLRARRSHQPRAVSG
jgi:diaminohydroxyphosphoribosylaminopyrimidine deaminase / 5-amino-6-(5-phosphoribosylamino)uracil reductase